MAPRPAYLDGGRELSAERAVAGGRLAVVANPAAAGGRTRRVAARVEAALRGAGFETSLHWSAGPRAVGDAVRRARDGGARAVALLGGDGTLHEALPALLEAPLPFVPLPCGRGNDFARALGIPRDAVAAARAVAGWAERPIDVGRAGGAPFLTVAAVGFDAQVAAAVSASGRRLPGPAAYLAASLSLLARYRAPALRLSGAFGAIEGRFFLVAAGNGTSYGGGMRIAPDARLDDGLLDLCVVEEIPRLTVLRLLPRVFSGAHVGHPAVRVVRAASVQIDASEPLEVYADGEPAARLPARLDVLPGALRVLAP